MTLLDALHRFALRFACHRETQPEETPEMTTTHDRLASGNDEGRQYRDLAQAIANQAQALADGTIDGSRYVQVRKIRANIDMLIAWTGDDRPFSEPMRQQPEQQHQAADTATEQRVCETCDQPVQLAYGSSTRHVHRHSRHDLDHPAQPRLAHAMDADPFAGIDASEGYVPGDVIHDMQAEAVPEQAVDTATGELVCGTCDQPIANAPTGDHYHVTVDWKAICGGTPHPATPKQAHATDIHDDVATDPLKIALRAVGEKQKAAAEPVFPPADPEPSISLAQFQQRVANGEWNVAGAGLPHPFPNLVKAAANAEDEARRKDLTKPVAHFEAHRDGTVTTQLPALQHVADAINADRGNARVLIERTGRHVYGGTVAYRTKTDRRARNRRNRAARRANRGH